ncbi:MAG: adenosylcobinamide-GDP ribazoletransferase [Pseudomonadales bacterium]|nr:adenosylcobinamide-GDP ribazoletransferase [Pseudomonadales bacterium]
MKSVRPVHLNEHVQSFLHAIMLFSRLPVGRWLSFSLKAQGFALGYWPLVGLVLSFLSLFFWFLLMPVFQVPLSVLVLLLSMLLMTGAMHEDGLADYFDGLGAGSAEEAQRIMKDSHLGVYGVLALFLSMAVKFAALLMAGSHLPVMFMAAHFFSRISSMSLAISLPYVRASEDRKLKDIEPSVSGFSLILNALAVLVFVLILPFEVALLLFIILILFRQLMLRQLKQRLGGYTGDCLGAAQQLAECVVYLVFAACLGVF